MIIIEKALDAKIDINEVYRYMGCKDATKEVADLVQRCLLEAENIITYKCCYERFAINIEDEIDLGFAKTTSKSLKKNLQGCSEIVLFTATIGIEIDRLIQKYSKVSSSSALTFQAIGGALIEQWCNELCKRFADHLKKEGKFLRPRFSPGYGDLPLDLQKDIFRVLDCSRRIGVSLTDGMLMIPTKSVSAIVGISNIDQRCNLKGCEACDNKNCLYRRG